MSVVTASELNDHLADEPADDIPTEVIELEEPRWEPRHIHVPRPVVWVLLISFCLLVIVMGLLGLARSTMTYGMSQVGAATTARLANIQGSLASAGVPASALRRLAVAARPGVNIGDAIEALADADRDLEPFVGNPAVVSIRTELRGILDELSAIRYGAALTPSVSATPLPTLTFPTP